MIRTASRLALAGACAASLGLALARPAAKAGGKPVHDPNLPKASEAAAASRPDATKAGSWQGSWYYSDRWSRLGFWFDQERSKPMLRYRYELKGEGDASDYGDTGETGTGPSTAGTGPGQIQVTWKELKDGSFHGRIVRTWPDPDQQGKVVEANDFDAWRIEPGDEMFLLFTNTTREHTTSEGTTTETLKDQGFTLRKLTDEIVHWEEMIG